MTRPKGPEASSTYWAPVVTPALAEPLERAPALAESPERSVQLAPAAARRRVEHPEQVVQAASPARAASRVQAGWAAAADRVEAAALEEPQG